MTDEKKEIVPSLPANLVEDNAESLAFEEYSEQRDEWLSTPLAHNTSLAESGAPFTIIAGEERMMPASELDIAQGYAPDTDKPVIAYLCQAQETWYHEPKMGPDIEFPEGKMFVIIMRPNPIRRKDLEKVQILTQEGRMIPNIALQQYPNRRVGFSPAVGFVAKRNWKPLKDMV